MIALVIGGSGSGKSAYAEQMAVKAAGNGSLYYVATMQVYDEEENLVDKTIIFDWVNNSEEESVFNKRVASAVKQALSALASKNVFENSHFVKPLSISLTDESFVVIEELLFLDDDTLRLDDPLLKDLDADLDDFLAKLLSDVE